MSAAITMLKPSGLAKALLHLITIKRPVFIWGPPGIGKSDIVAGLAEAEKLELRDIRLSLLDSVDLKGFPIADKDKHQMSWLPADFLPKEGKGILFLDEMNSAPPSVQAASYQLMLNRRIGDYKLPDGWSIIAAGNRESDRSVVHRMPSALANRLIHLHLEANLDDWCDWGYKNDIHSNTIGFLRFKPNLLNSFDHNANANPTPRTWAFADSISRIEGMDKETAFAMIAGAVGDGPAGEFEAFVRLAQELPTIEEILAKPKKIDVPTNPSVLYALVTSLAMKATTANFDVIMDFVTRIPPEFQVVFMRDTARRDSSVASCKAFSTWTSKNSSIIM